MTSTSVRATLLGAALAVGLTGCTPTGPLPETGINFSRLLPGAATWQGPGASTALVDDNWINAFNDPQLVALVDEAMQKNQDLRGAAARVDQARGLARLAGASLAPNVDGSLAATIEDEGPNAARTDGVEIGARLTWEVDVWGNLRHRRTAALYSVLAQEDRLQAARQSLAAAVADTWFVLNAQLAILSVDRAEVENLRNTQEISRTRVEGGDLVSVDLNIGAANISRAERRAIETENRIAQARRALEVFLFRYPAGDLAGTARLPALPAQPATGIPSQLLERRPDIRAQERQVAAAFFERSSAQAARLPQFTITADFSSPGSTLGTALSLDNLAWEMIGSVLVPIFDAGRRAAAVDIATARQEEALATYGSTAIVALEEVEAALTAEAFLARQQTRLRREVSNLLEAVRNEEIRYEEGVIGLLRLTDVKEDLFNARRLLIAVESQRLRQRVQLHLALGGSFELPPPPEPESSEPVEVASADAQ